MQARTSAVTCVYTDPDLVPFEPPARPLGLLGLRTLMRNYIETVPRSAYDQTVTHFRTRMSDVLIVSDLDIIQELLVDKAEAFGRDPTTRRSFAPVIGNTALFLAEGADWRWQRRAVAPIFRHDEQYAEPVDAQHRHRSTTDRVRRGTRQASNIARRSAMDESARSASFHSLPSIRCADRQVHGELVVHRDHDDGERRARIVGDLRERRPERVAADHRVVVLGDEDHHVRMPCADPRREMLVRRPHVGERRGVAVRQGRHSHTPPSPPRRSDRGILPGEGEPWCAARSTASPSSPRAFVSGWTITSLKEYRLLILIGK